jgi:Ca2+-binding EF-hand superfamily protein
MYHKWYTIETFLHITADPEGTITFELFEELYNQFATPTVEDLEQALKVFDTDDDGRV